MTNTKQVAAIHDLSGFGRCSLTVALPVLSVMGMQVSCLPTAVLSTHTGGFTGFTFRDLTGDMRAFYQHWQKERLFFDALYSGYLGSFEQISLVNEIFDAFETDQSLVLVDPVMADEGRVYSLYTPQMVAGMGKLCHRAHVLTPNMTEAALLTGNTYHEGPHSESYLKGLCVDLHKLGARQVVLTGASPTDLQLGAACYDGTDFFVYTTPRIASRYDGTGDVFASVLLGALLNGKNLPSAMRMAANFTHDCVERSAKNKTDPHHGVDFEGLLWKLGKEAISL